MKTDYKGCKRKKTGAVTGKGWPGIMPPPMSGSCTGHLMQKQAGARRMEVAAGAGREGERKAEEQFAPLVQLL